MNKSINKEILTNFLILSWLDEPQTIFCPSLSKTQQVYKNKTRLNKKS